MRSFSKSFLMRERFGVGSSQILSSPSKRTSQTRSENVFCILLLSVRSYIVNVLLCAEPCVLHRWRTDRSGIRFRSIRFLQTRCCSPLQTISVRSRFPFKTSCDPPYFSSHVRVTLVESRQILASFDARLQRYAEKKISSRPNFKLLHASVSEVDAKGVRLSTGEFLPAGLIVWSTGVAPRPLVQRMNVRKNAQKQILVDERLRIVSDESGSSFALGDCAGVEKNPLPQTAQVAERQGRYLARVLSSQKEEPFTFKSMGMLAYLGEYTALSDLPEIKLKGITSWFLWRSAYLTRLGSWRLRMQVPLDWIKTFLFGRDTSRFD